MIITQNVFFSYYIHIFLLFFNTIIDWRNNMRIFKKFFLFCFVNLLIVILGSFLYVKLSPKIIINSANNIILFDKDNESFFKGNQSNEWVNLDNISNELINSTVYTEDKHFYNHFGFDFPRIIKALFNNITNGTRQGASTITQQYAKNLFLEFDKTWKRKWDELWSW